MKDLEQNIARMEKELAEMKAKLEQSKVQYPIYCRSKRTNKVIRFDGLQSGVVFINDDDWNVGQKYNTCTKHTNTDFWEVLPFNKERGLFHGQAIWCCDYNDTHARFLKFYDAINDCTFSYKGKLKGDKYENYIPFKGNYTEWMLNAFNTLER